MRESPAKFQSNSSELPITLLQKCPLVKFLIRISTARRFHHAFNFSAILLSFCHRDLSNMFFFFNRYYHMVCVEHAQCVKRTSCLSNDFKASPDNIYCCFLGFYCLGFTVLCLRFRVGFRVVVVVVAVKQQGL